MFNTVNNPLRRRRQHHRASEQNPRFKHGFVDDQSASC